jgi:hypothetical protein
MPDRELEPWESGAAALFLWIETPRGNVEVWALGEDRFRIASPGGANSSSPALTRQGARQTLLAERLG